MNLKEKERLTLRLVNRMIRFHLLILHNQTYKNEPDINPKDNKYDNIGDWLSVYMSPFFHMRILALRLKKLRAIKTT